MIYKLKAISDMLLSLQIAVSCYCFISKIDALKGHENLSNYSENIFSILST